MIKSNNVDYVKKPVGRPKKNVDDPKFDKKTYMKEYMKEYNLKNKNDQYNKRNTSYYIKNFNIDKEFIDKYGIYTASIHKCIENITKINNECPMFLNDIKNIVNELDKKIMWQILMILKF